ncbi:trypsin-like serine peptidase [Streptomyces sp. YU58]|uniref:trypsin-like serine peptidase n=1 Tax=Streptomyces sp. SX92 TaxID=3158972 RepID=UPI0027BA34CF|nr:serine protease [Streptomyces coralus]WLW56892.1 serine protease [Streptomyces coralus]
MPATEEAREELQGHVADAARRYRESTQERERVEEEQAAGVLFPDAPETLAMRAERILDRGGLPPAAAVESVRAQALALPQAYERIISRSNELQAWSFLPRGARAAGTVARITMRQDGREIPHGTGFLVSPRLLMTNHHVLPNAGVAGRCFLEFNAQVTIDNAPDAVIRMEFDPGTFFTAAKLLDFALVAVAPASDGRLPGDVFGWNKLSAQPGNLVVGERVNIIGHPNGRLKEIALRDNALLVRLEHFLHYKTDTEPGNSGSPVFNDQWEVVALHHSGVPRTNDKQQPLRKDGQVWRDGDGDDAVDWIANEGVRISSIMRHLAALRLTAGGRALLAEMGPDTGLGSTIPGPVEGSVRPVSAEPETTAGTVAAAPTIPEASEGAAGLSARSPAGGKRHLVFLHGRRQHGKDPEVLRREWTAGLNQGLTRAGKATVDPADVWFPFYGNSLAERMGWTEAVRGAVERGEPIAPSAVEMFADESGLYKKLLIEAATEAGMPEDGLVATEGIGITLASKLQRALGWLTASTGLDEWTIATAFRDVSRYLSDVDVRKEVLDAVHDAMPTQGEVVLVTHSLGTVVGMDLIHKNNLDLTLLVTAGSPLGMDAVNERLLAGGPHAPNAGGWTNVWCPTDAVAIGCPLKNPGWGQLTQLAVANGIGRAHSITEYLAHAGVANAIDEALRTGA